jgi:hypothetical protein
MDLFFAICEAIGLALAACIAFVALSALVLDRPVGVLAGAAKRMEGEGHSARPLGLFALLAALLVAAATLAFEPLGLLAALLAARLYVVRRRRAASKHAGLRVLR